VFRIPTSPSNPSPAPGHHASRRPGLGLSLLLVGLAACSTTQEVEVPPGCGNGVLEEGEQCDPPSAGGCSDACRIIPSHINRCPELTFLFISPRQIQVGQELIVEATAADPDGDEVTYLWEAPGGEFEAATDAATTYTCSAPGPRKLTLHYGDVRGCDETDAVEVRCLAP